MDLDPAHLRSFLAIVRYGGYHRAADALHLTQPAVSRHIRRLEEQLGEPLFARRGRGVELTAYGERAAGELGDLLAAHDQTVARLQQAGSGGGPFVLGAIENIVDPILPDMLAAMREELPERMLQLRVDRSLQLVDGVARGEVDAAIVSDAGDARGALEVGVLTLRWWATPALAALDRAAGPAAAGGLRPAVRPARTCPATAWTSSDSGTSSPAESPHLTGVQAAARNGLGYALLAAGGDGLRRVAHGPLAEPVVTPLWLVLRPEHAALAAPLKAALWRATTRRALPAAA